MRGCVAGDWPPSGVYFYIYRYVYARINGSIRTRQSVPYPHPHPPVLCSLRSRLCKAAEEECSPPCLHWLSYAEALGEVFGQKNFWLGWAFKLHERMWWAIRH